MPDEPLGWVVLTNEVKNGPPKWEPDWDGAVHTDRGRADTELGDCRAEGILHGYDCALGVVRLEQP